MVKETFINLPLAKKDLVTDALLNEFSKYPLSKSQVARIVKNAGISRGSFYKYFTDLEDAYQYLYHYAMLQIHIPVRKMQKFSSGIFYKMVVNFIDQTQTSKFADLVKMHILYNEYALSQHFPDVRLLQLNSQNWSAMVLSHSAIRMILENENQKEKILTYLKAGLELLEEGAK
ncbi:TetR/AcrR family transcriptional regulator [Lactobacillus sp. ESL0228]|uniref:TetR/AcrR family transcriptional regulator n=1 Tax=Lactobacillus sp. ESL0228 TaxID=2069352 RepID=UPI000EFDA6EE|nr:TetR/AcrR family transcriptional regulator [Lactobacillus sp. ESL0228]RMC51555.1 TetR/AcrR family transcriptional regulator [Lactobacillus sp. ESL0228]